MHLPGRLNRVADGLSRNPNVKELDVEEVLEVPCFALRNVHPCDKKDEAPLSSVVLRKLQALDDWCERVKNTVVNGEELIKQSGLLCIPSVKGNNTLFFVLVPVVLRAF
jgi:hypothetical protein